jgi:hypothetical protein
MGLQHSSAPIVTDKLALLLETSNTNGYTSQENIFRYSEEHENDVWIKTSSVISTSSVTSPDGVTIAKKLIGNNNVSTRQSVYQDVPCNAGTTYTFSVYLKAAERRYATIWFDTANISEGAFYGAGTYIDLLTGTVVNGTQTQIVALPNGWYRCSVTATPTVGGTLRLNTAIGTPNNVSDGVGTAAYQYIGDGFSGIHIWGSQIESGSTATTYNKTINSRIIRTLYDLVGTHNFTAVSGTYDSVTRSLAFTRTMPPTTPESGGFANVTTTGDLTAANYLLNDHTTEVWFRPNNRNPTGYGGAGDETVSNIVVFTGYHSGWYYSATQYSYTIWSGNFTNAITYTLSFNDSVVGTWVQIVAVRSGNTLTLYKNGVSQTSGTIISSTASGTTSDSNLSIARANLSTQPYSWHADMNFASLRMYKKALTATEVDQNFQSVRRRFGL